MRRNTDARENRNVRGGEDVRATSKFHIRSDGTVLLRNEISNGSFDGFAVCVHDGEEGEDLEGDSGGVVHVHVVGFGPARCQCLRISHYRFRDRVGSVSHYTAEYICQARVSSDTFSDPLREETEWRLGVGRGGAGVRLTVDKLVWNFANRFLNSDQDIAFNGS